MFSVFVLIVIILLWLTVFYLQLNIYISHFLIYRPQCGVTTDTLEDYTKALPFSDIVKIFRVLITL